MSDTLYSKNTILTLQGPLGSIFPYASYPSYAIPVVSFNVMLLNDIIPGQQELGDVIIANPHISNLIQSNMFTVNIVWLHNNGIIVNHTEDTSLVDIAVRLIRRDIDTLSTLIVPNAYQQYCFNYLQQLRGLMSSYLQIRSSCINGIVAPMTDSINMMAEAQHPSDDEPEETDEEPITFPTAFNHGSKCGCGRCR